MLIAKDSLINSLPKGLEPRLVLLLDGIRTCVHIINDSTSQLYTLLYQASFEANKPENHRSFVCFWTIIDNSYRLHKLLCAIQESIGFKINSSALAVLKSTDRFRHTFQHMDDRIEEIFVNKKYPLFGELSWIARDSVTAKEGFMYCMMCGYYPYSEQAFNPVNPAGVELRNRIDLITLNSAGRSGNDFGSIQITLDSIISSITNCLIDIESFLSRNKSSFSSNPIGDIDLISLMKFEITSETEVTCHELPQFFFRTTKSDTESSDLQSS